MWQELLEQVKQGNVKALARSISLVENEYPGYESLLQSLPSSSTKIIGITGPPGAGKSSLINALLPELLPRYRRVAILTVDPSSPISGGAIPTLDFAGGVVGRRLAAGHDLAAGGHDPAAVRHRRGCEPLGVSQTLAGG